MKASSRRRSRAPIVGDMVCSLLTLPIALSYADVCDSSTDSMMLAVMLFLALFLMALARLFRAFRFRRKCRVRFVALLIYAAGLLCGAVGVLATIEGPMENAARIAGLIYWLTLLSDRMISIALNRRLKNILLNLLASLLIIWCVAGMIAEGNLMYFTMLAAAAHALLSIMTVTFARVNLSAMRKIIQRTYASEILLGLLLMILSFGYVLKFTEPGITSFRSALWYCFAIVTTIGFGDITATTPLGMALSVILGAYGIIVVALITSIIVNYYGEMKKEEDGD